jgi:UDPglucose--hexose-1-phosphate uridylyltransferase
MQELRFNPMTGEWVMISSGRKSRPIHSESKGCPLCPGNIELEQDYDLAVFENRFPALLKNPPPPHDSGSPLLKSKPSYGVCEVIMYTAVHNSALSEMPLLQIENLIDVWEDRIIELYSNPMIKYIFIFENKGEEVGATLSHPHGQLYAFPFLPLRVKAKLKNMKNYINKNQKCMLCDIIKEEMRLEKRLIFQNDYFLALVPYYARFPYEVHILSKRHLGSISDMDDLEKKSFAEALKHVTRKYDKVFARSCPYMMALFISPSEKDKYNYFHFHVEFCPPLREKNKIKWMASVETMTWQFINPSYPEEIAEQLRSIN